LAENTLEVLAPQGHEWNATCLKQHLREAQYTIMKLQEVKRVLAKQNMTTPLGVQGI
jgi:hypothetical protein